MKKIFLIIIGIFAYAYVLNVNKGWQLKGALSDINIQDLNSSNINSVWSYDEITKKWRAYFPNKEINFSNFINKLDTIKQGEGFWVNAYNNTNIVVGVEMIIPLYFYDVNKFNEIAQYRNEIVIINPDNGAGNSIDNNYKNLIDKLNNNQDLPIGYIYTKWGGRNIEEVKADIDKWIKFYSIKGFFVDETSTSKENLSYYKKLYDYIKSKGNYYIVLNPGAMPNSEYFDIADNIIVFEDSVNNLKEDVCIQNPDKSSIIVYNVSEAQMENIIKNHKCKGIYITDDTLPNPYDTLPGYFDKEIKLLK